jgi:hypothetical protein
MKIRWPNFVVFNSYRIECRKASSPFVSDARGLASGTFGPFNNFTTSSKLKFCHYAKNCCSLNFPVTGLSNKVLATIPFSVVVFQFIFHLPSLLSYNKPK